ncbi:hypothetical protein FA95DRAFT_1585854 [Auriscalpium vulgare]|uniref:Uncharacterized protein n=1 Tax=Auriscalpium vulgare TaxID=40419 RepID=A0ACB8SC85_9AGAM|nr:hypothetical protein FA95DRAFT_1585854 [Auriscalpium vulgare]
MSSNFLPISTTTQTQGKDAVTDYLAHPDYNVVAAFFLGWVFLSSMRHACHSPVLLTSLKRYKAAISPPTDTMGGSAVSPYAEKTGYYPSNPTEDHRREQKYIFVLLLCLFFMLASLSNFLSLLSYGPADSGTACAFVVASGLIASQAARLIGLLVLSLELRKRKIRKWEPWAFWFVLIVVMALTFATTAKAVGGVSRVPQLGISICSRKRFLPTAVLAAILDILLGLYVVIRVFSLSKPPRMKLSVVQDSRIVQGLSLILLELLVVVPNSTVASILVEFIPFSIGALLVITAYTAYNRRDATVIDINLSPPLPGQPPLPPVDPATFSIEPLDLSSLEANVPTFVPVYPDARPARVSAPQSETTSLASLPDATIQTSVRRSALSYAMPHQVPIPSLQMGPPQREEVQTRRFRILPSQTLFAASLDQKRHDGLGLPPRPAIRVNVPAVSQAPDYSPEDSQSEDRRMSSFGSPSSTILGSDIIRATSHGRKDRTKTRSHRYSQGLSPTSQTGSLVSPVHSTRHRSWASMRINVPNRSLPVVHERSSTAPTFGRSSIQEEDVPPVPELPEHEAAVAQVVLAGPERAGAMMPMLSPGIARTSLVRGPRPFPTNPPGLSRS